MKEIGGYLELELRRGEEYHDNAIRLNTGRNALEFILFTRKYSRVYIPYYTCDVILEPFKKLSVNYSFYSIDKNFEPIFNYTQMMADEAFLYTNYFGLKDSFVNKLSRQCKNLIVDNSQAFYSIPIAKCDTFYSCRKYFGVPDGAYLYLEGADSSHLLLDVSVDRLMHLVKRIDYNAEAGYNDFKINDEGLIGQPIKQMSNLSVSLLRNIDYEFVKEIRKKNFNILHDNLNESNKLNLSLAEDSVPLVYPFLPEKLSLREKLIKNKIFVATYWPNVLRSTNHESIEYMYASKLIPLPIDQRYSAKEMEQVLKLIT